MQAFLIATISPCAVGSLLTVTLFMPSEIILSFCTITEPNGELTTHSPSTYKIPAVNDMPEKFNVKIFKNLNKENVVNKSKTTGEPPLMLGMSVFFAIKDAISSIANHKIIPNLNAPATSEAILLSINDIKKKYEK